MARRRARLPLAPLERIMRSGGAQRVSNEAVQALRDHVEEFASSIAEEALKACRHARRRTVTREDIKLASR